MWDQILAILLICLITHTKYSNQIGSLEFNV